MHRSIQITNAIESLFSNARQRPLVILNEVKDLVSPLNSLPRAIRPPLSS